MDARNQYMYIYKYRDIFRNIFLFISRCNIEFNVYDDVYYTYIHTHALLNDNDFKVNK